MKKWYLIIALGLFALILGISGASPAAASGPLNILTVGANSGNRATETYVPTVGSSMGGVSHIGSTVSHVSEAGFNALTAAQLATYDVVLTQWASSGTTDLGSSKVQDYVFNGGALFLDGDYANYNDLSWVGISGATDNCWGPFTFTAAADPILTDTLPATPDLVNCHGYFPNFDSSVFVVMMTDSLGQNAALAGIYGSGRIILTGPDQDYHAHPTYEPQQYQLLLNELEWTGHSNEPPTADAGGPYLVAVNSTIPLDGTGTDPDGDTLSYAWSSDEAGSSFDDANTADPNYTAGSSAGIYDVCLTVTDVPGGLSSEEACTIVVVYDPSAGFVTGGGWIYSAAGNYKADETLEGKANFGFVAKYRKGADVPSGNTEFQFKAGDLNFHSTSYEWLVVAGNKAQFKGEGMVNGVEGYTFKLSADDDSPDTFRIQIWATVGLFTTMVHSKRWTAAASKSTAESK